MIWWQAECKFGDMIRVSCGNFYHYGIFATEEEVIQFGLPPFDGLLNRNFEDVSICVSTIDEFSGGKAVEVAFMEKADKRKRLAPKKTVRRAREKIGERGYDILHNNCEHFARYCYFGEKECEVTDGVVSAWKSKPVCDIYFSVIPSEIDYEELAPSERNAEVFAVTNETVKKSKYWAWKTLEYALFRSFGYKIRELGIIKEKNGKWACKKCYFSISHSQNAVAVIVSNKETGIDIEERSSFYEKFDDTNRFESFSKKIVSKKEKCPSDKAELIKLWTKKECAFKQSKARAFIPSKVCTVNQDLLTFKATIGGKEIVGSVVWEDTALCRFYGYDGQSATKFKDIEWDLKL